MQTKLKFSRQREAVLNAIQSTKSHPTAEWVYENVKPEFPNISLATVYRNLNLLCDCGSAMRVHIGDGKEHFDANVENHYHFCCRDCGGVIDVSEDEIPGISKPVEDKFGFKVDTHSIVFYGLCKECK